MSLLDDIAECVRSGRRITSMDKWGPSKVYPPVDPLRVELAERRLGFSLPPLLRDLYVRVGNGGFGPGYGLAGIDGGAPFHGGSDGYSILELYAAFRARRERGEPWGEKLLPICHWGCSYYSYLDCALPQAPVMALDENSHGHGPWGCAFSLHAHSFEDWMRRWVDGEDLWANVGLEGEPILWFEENAEAR